MGLLLIRKRKIMPFWTSGITAKQEAEAERAQYTSVKWKAQFQKGESFVLLPEQAWSFWGTGWLQQTFTEETISFLKNLFGNGRSGITNFEGV